MVGGEKGRVIAHDAADGGRPREFLCQKPADPVPVPALGMDEFPVQAQIPFVKIHCLKGLCVIRVGWQIKHRKIQKINCLRMIQGKLQSLPGAVNVFGRSAEQQVDIACDAGGFEGMQGF